MQCLLVLHNCVSMFIGETEVELELRNRPRSIPRTLFDALRSEFGMSNAVEQTIDEDKGERVRVTDGLVCVKKHRIRLPQLEEFSRYGFDVRLHREIAMEIPIRKTLSARIKSRHVHKRKGHEIHLTHVVRRAPYMNDAHTYEVEIELYPMDLNLPSTGHALHDTLVRIKTITTCSGILEPVYALSPGLQTFQLPRRHTLSWQDLEWNASLFAWDRTILAHRAPDDSKRVAIIYGASETRFYVVLGDIIRSWSVKKTGHTSFILDGIMTPEGLQVCDIPFYGHWLETKLRERMSLFQAIKPVLSCPCIPVEWNVVYSAEPHNLPTIQGPRAFMAFKAHIAPGMVLAVDEWDCDIECHYNMFFIPHNSPAVELLACEQATGHSVLCTAGERGVSSIGWQERPLTTTAGQGTVVATLPNACEIARAYSVQFTPTGPVVVAQADDATSRPAHVVEVERAASMAATPLTLANLERHHAIHLQLSLLRIAELVGGTWTTTDDVALWPAIARVKSGRMLSMQDTSNCTDVLIPLTNHKIPDGFRVMAAWAVNTNAFMEPAALLSMQDIKIHLLRKA